LKYHCTVDLLFDWFGISCMTTDNFRFYLQNRLIQTCQTGGQQYSDTSPFSIPWQSLSIEMWNVTSISRFKMQNVNFKTRCQVPFQPRHHRCPVKKFLLVFLPFSLFSNSVLSQASPCANLISLYLDQNKLARFTLVTTFTLICSLQVRPRDQLNGVGTLKRLHSPPYSQMLD
jgi:hypothetical protein